MPDPITPFTVAGILYDVDGTSVIDGGRVFVSKFSSGTLEKTEVSTNASGEFTLDLANLETQWAVNDVLYLYYKGSGKNAVVRAIITTGDTVWNQDLYAKVGEISDDQEAVVGSFHVSSEDAISVMLIDRKKDLMKSLVNVGANGTAGMNFNSRRGGLYFDEGVYILQAAQGTNINDQTAGVSNAIGDTSTQAGLVITAPLG